MKENVITNINQWNELLGKYQDRNTLTNNYMLPTEIEQHIENGGLKVSEGTSNLFLYIEKPKCKRVYYYLNDLEEYFKTSIDSVLALEILFRDVQGVPNKELEYFSKNGFILNRRRDQYSGAYKTMAVPMLIQGVLTRKANNLEEVKRSCDLFNSVFDNYSGDFITEEEIPQLYEDGDIIVVTDLKGNYLGALHQTIVKNTAWVSHVAVIEESRGRGAGKALLDTFVEWNKCEGKGRYMLWVQSQNTPAINMYKQKGFKYVGKSTISMIKLTNK